MKKSTTGPTWVATFLKVLTFFVSSIYWQQASAACPVHNHLCTFHALGAKVDVTLPPGVTFNPANSLVIYAIGKDPVTGAASTVDFDNEARLPTYTGDKFLAGNPANYTLSAGPYIVNTTTYGATHPPGTWSVPGDSGLQVTPSQYKNTFNANTAVAKHTGDFNGGENGNIPGATGCPNMPGAANCEAVIVTGNVPSGVYEQKVRLFNFYGVPDPKVDLQVGAYVTGQLVIVANSHDVNQVASFPKLEGTGNTTPTYQYEVYNRQFDPHAAGVATFDRMNWGKVRTVGNEYSRNGHRFLTQVQDSTTTRTKVYGDTGWAMQNTWVNKPKTVGYVYVGEEPKPIVSVPDSTASTQIGVGGLKIRGANELSLTGFSTTQQNVPPIGYCIGVFCPGVTPMKLADVANTNLTPISEIQIPACTTLGCPLVYKDASKEQKSGIQTNKFLDGLQTGGDYVSLVGVTGAGEVVSTPVDIGNTALSFARATTNTAKTYGYVLSGWIFDDPAEYKKAEELNGVALSQYKDASLSALGIVPFLNGGALKQGVKHSDEVVSLIDGADEGVKAIADTQAALTQQVPYFRSILTGNAKSSGNMGVAQIDIPGVQPMMVASSQLDVPTTVQQSLGFVGKISETFPSSVVPTASKIPYLLLRDVDSEAKILNNVAAQLGDNKSVAGTINLLTERSPCASCSNVIELFKTKYPSITVNVFDNNGKIIKPKNEQ